MVGSHLQSVQRVRYIRPRTNIPLEERYLAVAGHNAIRISPVVRRRRRLEGTTHGMLFTLNYSRHCGRNTHYPLPPPRRRCTCGSQPHHPRKPTDILDKRCPGTKIPNMHQSIHRGKGEPYIRVTNSSLSKGLSVSDLG